MRNLDGATGLVLGLFLAMAVIVGAVATQAGRRAAGSEQARGVLAEDAAKHAQASVIDLCVDARDGALTLSISDDGVGGADPSRGSGVIGLRDRVGALGGTTFGPEPIRPGNNPARPAPGRSDGRAHAAGRHPIVAAVRGAS